MIHFTLVDSDESTGSPQRGRPFPGGGDLSDSGMRDSAATPRTVPPAGVGSRVRALRVAAGLTQTALAGERFSKEYVSQIERGKTRPTDETVSWLAERLGVDAEYLLRGVSSDVRTRVEAKLAQAEALSESHRDPEAVDLFREARGEISSLGSAELEVRAPPREAIDVLQVARALTERPEFSDLDRADVLFRLGCCRYRISSIPTAISLLDEALELAEGSGLP